MECQSNVCREAGGSFDDSGPENGNDGRPFAVDAAPEIDAVPVECSSSTDCQSPPDLCYMVGVCDIDSNLCVFPKVTCATNEACATNQCNGLTGECEKTSTNENASCDTQTCNGFGACAFDDSNSCDETGIQSRACTDFVCTSGSCVGNNTVEMQSCSRVTEGDDCNGGTTCPMFGNCIYEMGICDESGSQTRTCTDNNCGSGACVAVNRNESQPCTRTTEGNTCDFQDCGGGGGGGGIQEVCCAAGSCNDLCGFCDQF